MHKDPSLPNNVYTLTELEQEIIMAGLAFRAMPKGTFTQSELRKVSMIIHETFLHCQNTMLKALKVLQNPNLLALCPDPENKTNN